MSYTNSSLVSYTKLSPNHSGQRTHSIDRITPHCVVGNLSAESICGCFTSTSRKASCNYGIGKDGRVSLCVEEKNRSWCSSSNANDQRAITIECASDMKEPYAMNDAVYNSLIKLCTDICKRNGKKKLLWFGDKTKTLNYSPASDEMVLTVHRWFANKSCVPTSSEVLTRYGWVPISDIEIGDEIACADLDNLHISFEEVYDKVPVRQQDTYTNNEMTATKDHRMVYSCQQSKDLYRIEDFKHLLAYNGNIYIPLAGHADFDGLPITNEMLQLLVAVQADGHYMYEVSKTTGEKRYYGLEFHLRKERKIERVVELLKAVHLDYRVTNQSNGSTKIRVYNHDGINIVNDICEKYLDGKCFTWEWLNLSPKQAQIFLKELLYWDGCEAANSYCSCDAVNLDIVNAVAALNGVGSRVIGNSVQFRESPYITLAPESKRNSRSHNGSNTEVSCVSVKTGIFLMRQNGKTFITGNCPGDWLYSRLGDLASKVTANLGGSSSGGSTTPAASSTMYRVRKTWSDAASQKGAFTSLSNAKACADANAGYSVFDESGKAVYTGKSGTSTSTFTPYKVRISISNLNIRKGPGTGFAKTGKFTGKGIFTIVDEADGNGSKKGWGLLKAYEENADGWVSLDYCTKV